MALKPTAGRRVLAVAKRIEKMTIELLDAQFVKTPHHCQETGLVGRYVELGRAEKERLVTLVGATVDQVGRLRVGACDDDAGHPHDVELEAGGVEPLDLFVGRHQDLAALVAALLGAGSLVLDVVARHTDLDEAADQVAYVRIAAVAGVGVGDDKRAEVVSRCRRTLSLAHLQA